MGLECWKIQWLEPKTFDLRVESFYFRVTVPFTMRRIPRGFPFCNSAGNALSTKS